MSLRVDVAHDSGDDGCSPWPTLDRSWAPALATYLKGCLRRVMPGLNPSWKIVGCSPQELPPLAQGSAFPQNLSTSAYQKWGDS